MNDVAPGELVVIDRKTALTLCDYDHDDELLWGDVVFYLASRPCIGLVIAICDNTQCYIMLCGGTCMYTVRVDAVRPLSMCLEDDRFNQGNNV